MILLKKIRYIAPKKLIVISVALGAFSWLLESFIHSQFFYTQYPDFFHQLFFPDAHEIWMRLTIISLFIAFAIYAQRIIEALVVAENAVRVAHMELIQIFETSADGMRVVDLDFNVLRVNKTFLSLAGLTREETEGRKCFDIFSGDICHTDRCPMVRILAGEERIEYDELKVRQDGLHIPCIVTATPFRESSGAIIGIVEDFKDISERKEAEVNLHKSHEQLRTLTSHMEMVREKERRHMAREIHDELGQSLTVLKMDIHWLKHHVPDQAQQTVSKLADMGCLLDDTVHTVQRLSAELRPGLLDDLGVSAAIEWQANLVMDRLGLDFNLVSVPEDITLDETCSIIVYRIFQETLTNIARHSGATFVYISLQRTENNVTLVVRDNGNGITEEQIHDPQSLGLIGMRERVNSINGTFAINGNVNDGTTVQIKIPL